MSTGLTLVEAARRSGIGLHSLMKAIRAGELGASHEKEGGYSITERELVKFQKKRPSLSDILGAHQLQTDQSGSEDTIAIGDALKQMRSVFEHNESESEPKPPPQPVEPNAVPARDLGQWCDSYLDDLRKVDWYLRKLEADAEWACRHLALDTVPETDNPDEAKDAAANTGKA